MSATLTQTPFPASVRPPAPAGAPEMSTDQLVRRIAAAVERHPAKATTRRYRVPVRGQPLHWRDLLMGAALLAAFGWAIWLQARPIPADVGVARFRALALTAGDESTPAPAFVEAMLVELGREWDAAVVFSRAHAEFWGNPRKDDPNALVRRVEEGLSTLGTHGRVVKATVLRVPSMETVAAPAGGTRLVGELQGQVECEDGTVLPFAARLIRDESVRKWGLAALSIPPELN